MGGFTGKSVGRGVSGNSGNSGIQQMVLGAAAGQTDINESGALQRNFTAIDEMVQQRLQQIALDYDD